jgi:hypothetical protein
VCAGETPVVNVLLASPLAADLAERIAAVDPRVELVYRPEPHSMSTARTENEWLTNLFCDNLRRYLNGEPLRNQVDKTRGY